MTRKESVKIIVFSNLLDGGSLNIELFLGGGVSTYQTVLKITWFSIFFLSAMIAKLNKKHMNNQRYIFYFFDFFKINRPYVQ